MANKGLLKSLTDKPQRETAGSDTASRFDYQKNWAFCEMLSRHMAGADYLVAFEFHDDVVFLTPSNEPTRAEFHQVKTSKSAKPKKLKDVLSRDEPKNSILGKMCLNFDGICETFDTHVVLVSNVPFEFDGKKVCASSLSEAQRKLIVQKLSEELAVFPVDSLDRMHFLVTGVGLDEMSAYLQGVASELFKSVLGENHGVNVHAWVRLIQGEIDRRNNYPSGDISSANELISQKCIGKKFVDETISEAHARVSHAPDVTALMQSLPGGSFPVMRALSIGKRIPEAITDYYDPENKDAARLAQRLRAELDTLGTLDMDTLRTLLNCVFAAPEDYSCGISLYNDANYLCALGVVVFHEKL